MAQQQPRRFRLAPRMRVFDTAVACVAVVLSIVSIVLLGRVFEAMAQSKRAHDSYVECSAAANQMLSASDFLTTQARMFAVTGDPKNMQAYLNELFIANRRNRSVEQLGKFFRGTAAYLDLYQAITESNTLSQRELYAIRLTADSLGLALPEELERVHVADADAQKSPDEKREMATSMLWDEAYLSGKLAITERVDACTTDLIAELEDREYECEELLDAQLGLLRVNTGLLLLTVLVAVFANIYFMTYPLLQHARSIKEGEPLEPLGSQEVREVVLAYNEMYSQNRQQTSQLQYEAEHDPLTGLLNRGSYDRLLADAGGNVALLLVDIDRFKGINDEYGHETGDAVLKKAAGALSGAFRDGDWVCRIGGDEFAVIATGVTDAQREDIAAMVGRATAALADVADGLPKVTLSVGVAFDANAPDRDLLYKAADLALYEVKNNGRNGLAFFDPAMA